MVSWGSSSCNYWQKADDMAKNVYHQLFSQVSERGSYFYEAKHILGLDYVNSYKSMTGFVDFVLTVKTDSRLNAPDNLGFCLAADDHCEIEIISYIPKHYRISKLKKSKEYQHDLLNVIRHEIEHMLQAGAYAIKDMPLLDYDKHKDNFLLESAEVPAYVHGFRISTKNNSSFDDVIDEFISAHGSALSLSKEEIQYTKKVWQSYLKNLHN